MVMKNIKHILCFILSAITAVLLLSGCADGQEASELFLSSTNESREGAENRDEFNSMLKSWEIFMEAAHGASTEMESESMVEAVKNAMGSEAYNKRISLRLSCDEEEIDTYRSIVGEFKWLYANDDKYRLNIEIVANKNNAGDETGNDIFFFEDRELCGKVASGSLSRINDEMKRIAANFNSPETIQAFTMDEKLYGFPVASARGGILLYDKNVYGEEILSLEDMIKKAEKNKKSVMFALDDPLCSAQVFMSAGCRLEASEEAQYIGYDTKQGLEAAKTINELAGMQGSGFIGTGGKKELIEGFLSGKLCAAVTDEYIAHQLWRSPIRDSLGIAKLPSVRLSGKDTQLHSFEGYRAVGVNPRSGFPFTAQMLAYYISSERSQMAAYYSCGSIPAVTISEYSEIAEDALYKIMTAQDDYQHIAVQTVSGAFYDEMEKKNIGKRILSMNGKATEDQLIRMLSEITLVIPRSASVSAGTGTTGD